MNYSWRREYAKLSLCVYYYFQVNFWMINYCLYIYLILYKYNMFFINLNFYKYFQLPLLNSFKIFTLFKPRNLFIHMHDYKPFTFLSKSNAGINRFKNNLLNFYLTIFKSNIKYWFKFLTLDTWIIFIKLNFAITAIINFFFFLLKDFSEKNKLNHHLYNYYILIRGSFLLNPRRGKKWNKTQIFFN